MARRIGLRRTGSHSGEHVDTARRNLLKAAGLLVADLLIEKPLRGIEPSLAVSPGNKVILLISGGVRFAETFSPEGIVNIPNLSAALAPKALFYPHMRNEGVTSHFNATSSILTGNWQRVDDWGKTPAVSPTIFELLRRERSLSQKDTWIISSNKALTSNVGASSVSGFGPRYGANTIFPKKLLISAVETAILQGRGQSLADKAKAQAEIAGILNGSNYEGLGWNVFDASTNLDPGVRAMILDAVAELVHQDSPITGDELTHLIAIEVMRRFAPSLLVVSFSDVEAAHFGAYSLHLSGIHNLDRLAGGLWQEAETNPAYRGRTTMIIVPEFGRDPNGSRTNGFFNHRSNTDSCRDTWMMCLGEGVTSPRNVERPIHHVDICPTIAAILGCKATDVAGTTLSELSL